MKSGAKKADAIKPQPPLHVQVDKGATPLHRELSTKALPPAPDVVPPPVPNGHNAAENGSNPPVIMVDVPVDLIKSQFPDMLGDSNTNPSLEKSRTMSVDAQPIAKAPASTNKSPAVTYSTKQEKREEDAAKLDPDTQYYEMWDGEAGAERCASLAAKCSDFKPKCLYALSGAVTLLDKSVVAFPMSYMLASFCIAIDNPAIGPGFVGYLGHNLLEIAGSHTRQSLKKALYNSSNWKRSLTVGLVGLGANVGTQQLLRLQDNPALDSCSVGCSVVLPAAAMLFTNYGYSRCFPRPTLKETKLQHSNLNHPFQKMVMIGLDMIKTVGFSLAFHGIANAAKFTNQDASKIFSHCVEWGWGGMTVLKAVDLAKFYFSTNKKDRVDEIKKRGGRFRLLFPEGLAYAVTAIAYTVAVTGEHMGFSTDPVKCLQDSPEDVAAKAAKLMTVYGFFRLVPELVIDCGRLTANAKSKYGVHITDGDTAFLPKSGSDENRLEASASTVGDDQDQDPVTSGYLPPSEVGSVNGNRL